ncbi:hypothetical protein OKA04_08985 [Luteolibacter flavescens]|uniref:Uncharacterized protein n=1 Tax=Luteolibacter flavescens TaxID=1859460 RepID=A0ABT3FMR3_9BACT|nr:hypothetical protein [Luteolibacter flavescens]MCW1884861.1 hypothetical protein [Luteolibacter flavescens]
MKNQMHGLIYSLAIANFATITGVADPAPDAGSDSSVSHYVDEPKPLKGELMTDLGLKVKPPEGWSPPLVPQEDWPDVAAPTTFNQAFETPDKIWRIDGGFLASFDAGEFGGALFFSQHGAKRWTKVVDAHVTHLERFEGDTYLVAGGLAHLSITEGKAYLLSRSNTGRWRSKVVFATEVGVPFILGTTFTEPIGEAKTEKLIVIALYSGWGKKALFGLSQHGAVHYLGDRPEQNGGGHGDAERPAAPSGPEPGHGDPRHQSEPSE